MPSLLKCNSLAMAETLAARLRLDRTTALERRREGKEEMAAEEESLQADIAVKVEEEAMVGLVRV